jgi:Domain of unknown function (DUF4157)
MFEHEPEAIERRAAPGSAEEAHAPAAERAPGRRPLAVHDTASLLHLQRTVGNAGVVQMLAEENEEPSPVHDVVGRGGGSPLDDGTRSTMESSFGQDFGGVRVHTDQRASDSAAAVGANAYTVGSDIVFRSGHFDPSTPTGQRTIAHELSHVVQQRSGPVDGTDAPGGIRLSDPDDRFERAADATADHVLGGSSSTPAAGSPGSAPAVQLEAAEEQEEAALPLQRQVGEEEIEEDEASA